MQEYHSLTLVLSGFGSVPAGVAGPAGGRQYPGNIRLVPGPDVAVPRAERGQGEGRQNIF